jgi:hypothetical protein
LFAEDLNRAAPFDNAATVPDASVARAHTDQRPGRHEHRDIDPQALEQAREWGDKLRDKRFDSAACAAAAAAARLGVSIGV